MAAPRRPPTADGYPAVNTDLKLTCSACAAQVQLSFPLLSDWRDRQRLDVVRSRYPVVSCPSCGTGIPVPSPVVVLRPTDPIPVLFCATDGGPEQLHALQEVLAAHCTDEHGVIVGPIANTDPELLGVVADQYSGFQLLGLPADEQGWAADEPVRGWLTGMRVNHAWPDVAGAVNDYLAADSPGDQRAVFDREPVLSEPGWAPVIRWVGARTAAGQDTTEQAMAVRNRMRYLARWRMAGRTLDPGDPTVQQAFTLLEQLTAIQSSATRTQEDVRRGIDIGQRLIELATGNYGRTHPLTVTALNDTAALMLDDADAPETMTGQARSLLAEARAVSLHDRSATLADATTNLGIAQLRRDRIADADVSETAIAVLQDAVHLQRLFYPDEPARALSALANLGALTRSRLTGDPAANIDEAISLLIRARELSTGQRPLTVPDQLTLETNLLSALFDRATLQPSPEHERQVLDAIDALDAKLDQLAADHPARIRAYTNLGSIAMGLLYRGDSHRPLADLGSRAERWLSDAYQQTQQLAPDDATRVLAASTLAALHFRRGGEDHLRRAQELLTGCVTALADSRSTRLHHTVYDNLARLHLAAGRWEDAIDVLEQACRHADAVIARAATASTRLAQVAAAGDLYQRLALLYTHRRNARAAIHTVERSRARWRNAHARFDPDELDRAVNARLLPDTALLYAGTCGLGSYAVLLVGGRGAGAWTTRTTTSDLAPLLTALQAARTIGDVAAVLDSAAAQLADGLLDQAGRILASASVARLSIVASGALAGLPLAALPGPGGPLAETVTVDYLIGATTGTSRTEPPASAVPASPSVTGRPAGEQALGSPPSDPDTAAIVDPTGDLPFATSELTAVRRYAPAALTPPEGVGVRGWLLAQLPTVAHLHLACHARYEPKDPFASRLILGEDLSLTVADLAEVATPRLSLVVASCCQTGVVDQRGADELVGFAQALIAAGAGSAVAALWEIDDAATSLLVAKFYDGLATGTKPADALADAQRALRTATIGDLAVLAQPHNDASWVPAPLRSELRALTLHPDFRRSDSRPFAHPAHWAGLVYLGR